MLPRRLQRKLSAAARHFSTFNISPAEITLTDLEAYCDNIVSNRMRRNADKSVDEFIWAWNQTVKLTTEWPQIAIPRVDKRYPYSLPFSAFPPSFEEDVKGYTQRLARGPLFDLDDDDDDFGPLRPVRPATVATSTRQIRAAASALVHSETDPRTITSIAVLVEIPNAKKILNFYMKRKPDQGTSGGIAQMASPTTVAAISVPENMGALGRLLTFETLADIFGSDAVSTAKTGAFERSERFGLTPEELEREFEQEKQMLGRVDKRLQP